MRNNNSNSSGNVSNHPSTVTRDDVAEHLKHSFRSSRRRKWFSFLSTTRTSPPHSTRDSRSRRRGRSRYRYEDVEEEPFTHLFLRVGFLIALASTSAFLLYTYQSMIWQFSSDAFVPTTTPMRTHWHQAIQEFPNMSNVLLQDTSSLTSSSSTPSVLDAYDAFGILQQYPGAWRPKKPSIHSDWNLICTRLRSEFVRLYGAGETDWARALLQRGIHRSSVLNNESSRDPTNATATPPTFLPTTLLPLARRLHRRLQGYQQQQQYIKDGSWNLGTILVLGSSAAAGIKNHRQDAYPNVLQQLWTESTTPQQQKQQQQVPSLFQVYNLAFEDVSAFPLLWCAESMLQTQQQQQLLPWTKPDIVIWDFPQDSVERLEAFIRNTMSLWQPALMVFRNPSPQQIVLIDYYMTHTNNHVPTTSMLILRESKAVQPFLRFDPSVRPPGLNQWNEQGRHHQHKDARGSRDGSVALSVQRHSLVAWLMAMQVVAAMELVIVQEQYGREQEVLYNRWYDKKISSSEQERSDVLPPPVSIEFDSNAPSNRPWQSLFLGESVDELHCYTGFEIVHRQSDMTVIPGSVNYPSTLQDILIRSNSGMASSAAQLPLGSDQDLLVPKVQFYHQGWVLDLDETSKQSKLLTKDSDFLGSPDWKKAYFGTRNSLEFLLPMPAVNETSASANQLVQDVFGTIILCESYDPLIENRSCKLDQDVQVDLGEYYYNTSISRYDEIRLEPLNFGNPRERATLGAACFELVYPRETKIAAPRPFQLGNNSSQWGLPVRLTIQNPKTSVKGSPCSLAQVIYTVKP